MPLENKSCVSDQPQSRQTTTLRWIIYSPPECILCNVRSNNEYIRTTYTDQLLPVLTISCHLNSPNPLGSKEIKLSKYWLIHPSVPPSLSTTPSTQTILFSVCGSQIKGSVHANSSILTSINATRWSVLLFLRVLRTSQYCVV